MFPHRFENANFRWNQPWPSTTPGSRGFRQHRVPTPFIATKSSRPKTHRQEHPSLGIFRKSEATTMGSSCLFLLAACFGGSTVNSWFGARWFGARCFGILRVAAGNHQLTIISWLGLANNNCLVVFSTHLKNMRKSNWKTSFPIFGMKIKKIWWNHHLEKHKKKISQGSWTKNIWHLPTQTSCTIIFEKSLKITIDLPLGWSTPKLVNSKTREKWYFGAPGCVFFFQTSLRVSEKKTNASKVSLFFWM